MVTSDSIAGLREQIIDNAAVFATGECKFRVVLTTQNASPPSQGLSDIFKGYRAHLVDSSNDHMSMFEIAAGGLKGDVKSALESLVVVMARAMTKRKPCAFERISEDCVEVVGDGFVNKAMLFPGS